jgi:hypothetical protein
MISKENYKQLKEEMIEVEDLGQLLYLELWKKSKKIKDVEVHPTEDYIRITTYSPTEYRVSLGKRPISSYRVEADKPKLLSDFEVIDEVIAKNTALVQHISVHMEYIRDLLRS